jgi:hypothetical protein
MIKNKQLFRHEPDVEFIYKLIKCFNIKDLNDNHQFCKHDLELYKTVEKINDLILEMRQFYVPCKSISYLSEIDEKRCITILKHFISIYNYTLNRKEVIKKNKKVIYYNIISVEENKMKITFENDTQTINFD